MFSLNFSCDNRPDTNEDTLKAFLEGYGLLSETNRV
jgi:hypothetical protein